MDLINAMPFARGLGIELLSAEPAGIEARFEVVEAEDDNRGGFKAMLLLVR